LFLGNRQVRLISSITEPPTEGLLEEHPSHLCQDPKDTAAKNKVRDMDQHTTEHAIFVELQGPETKAGCLSAPAPDGLTEETALQPLVDLFQNRNFLTFSHIEAATGLTQTELAKALGITFQQIQKYEKGVNRISASKLQQISTLLQAPISFFFESFPVQSNKPAKKSDPFLLSNIPQFMATADGVSLAKAFMQIKSPKLRHCIVSLAEELTSKASR